MFAWGNANGKWKKSPWIIKRRVKPERFCIVKISTGVVCPVLHQTFGEWPGAPGENEKEHHSTRKLRKHHQWIVIETILFITKEALKYWQDNCKGEGNNLLLFV